jgi:outer membrane protein, heavy metal efflux system
MNHSRLAGILVVLLLLPLSTLAQVTSLTLPQALDLARRRAPTILAGQDRIQEARGHLLGAKVLFRDNPVLDFSAGPRRLPGSTVTDFEIGASQSFELGGRRRSRIASAQADIERESASSQNTARELLRDVSAAFWRALAAHERLGLATSADKNANELLRGTQKRYDLGDIPILDVNIARNAAAKARLEVRSAEADETLALGDLRIFLGMNATEPLTVSGDLREQLHFQLDEMLAAASQRPDLVASAAELRQAEADLQLGKASAWPDLGLGLRHGRDEGNVVTKGELTFTLPVFSRGQELRATSEARATRLRRELAANQQAVVNEITTAFDLYQRKMQAADELARNAVQSLDENENLARRSYEEGEINLLDLLLIRGDTFETRLLYLNQLLDTALARVDVEARAGVLK